VQKPRSNSVELRISPGRSHRRGAISTDATGDTRSIDYRLPRISRCGPSDMMFDSNTRTYFQYLHPHKIDLIASLRLLWVRDTPHLHHSIHQAPSTLVASCPCGFSRVPLPVSQGSGIGRRKATVCVSATEYALNTRRAAPSLLCMTLRHRLDFSTKTRRSLPHLDS